MILITVRTKVKPCSADHFQHFLAHNETKSLVAETPDIIYVDVPDRQGWDKMAES